MKHNENFELVLNHITAAESNPEFKETFEEYSKVAHHYLNHARKHLFKDDILDRYREGANFEKVLEQNSFQYIQGMNYERNGKMEKTWYDIMGMDIIHPFEPMGDFFFTCKLRHLGLLQIDDYLSYHLEHSFENDKQKFLRYLTLTVRTYEKPLSLKFQLTETVKEWIKLVETSQDSLETEKSEKIKERVQREAGDKLTSLSLIQTVKLIEFMQKAGIILNSTQLTYTQAGKAFNLLTGYSSNSIRLQLGKGEDDSVKHEDYKELYEAVLKLGQLIEPKIRKK